MKVVLNETYADKPYRWCSAYVDISLVDLMSKARHETVEDIIQALVGDKKLGNITLRPMAVTQNDDIRIRVQGELLEPGDVWHPKAEPPVTEKG